jgi:hypothetical protein
MSPGRFANAFGYLSDDLGAGGFDQRRKLAERIARVGR